MLPRPVCQVRMEIQIFMLNVLVLKFWQLMEAYAGNSDYLVTRHIVTVFDIFLYFICCFVIAFYVYLFSLTELEKSYFSVT